MTFWSSPGRRLRAWWQHQFERRPLSLIVPTVLAIVVVAGVVGLLQGLLSRRLIDQPALATPLLTIAGTWLVGRLLLLRQPSGQRRTLTAILFDCIDILMAARDCCA
jgi:hypothetical protein